MGTEGVSGAARARVDAAGEVVHVAEHFDVQTSCAQERYVIVLEDRPDHTLGPELRITTFTVEPLGALLRRPRHDPDVQFKSR